MKVWFKRLNLKWFHKILHYIYQIDGYKNFLKTSGKSQMFVKYFLINPGLCWFINPVSRGEGQICPPYHISAIFSGSTYPRRLQLYSKFKFCNYLTPKIGLVSEKFSYDPWEALKVGRVAHFLLRFCLEIGYDFTFTEKPIHLLVSALFFSFIGQNKWGLSLAKLSRAGVKQGVGLNWLL